MSAATAGSSSSPAATASWTATAGPGTVVAPARLVAPDRRPLSQGRAPRHPLPAGRRAGKALGLRPEDRRATLPAGQRLDSPAGQAPRPASGLSRPALAAPRRPGRAGATLSAHRHPLDHRRLPAGLPGNHEGARRAAPADIADRPRLDVESVMDLADKLPGRPAEAIERMAIQRDAVRVETGPLLAAYEAAGRRARSIPAPTASTATTIRPPTRAGSSCSGIPAHTSRRSCSPASSPRASARCISCGRRASTGPTSRR